MRGLSHFFFTLLLLTRCICSSSSGSSLAPDSSDGAESDSSDEPTSESDTSSANVDSNSSTDSMEDAKKPTVAQSSPSQHTGTSPTITDEPIVAPETSQVKDVGLSVPGSHQSESQQAAPIAAALRDDFTGADDREELKAAAQDDSSTDDGTVDPASAVVKQLLNHLFGEAVDSFSTSDSLSKMKGAMSIDCNNPVEDSDAKFNVVTTLCPFLRPESPCGRIRHPSYEIEDEEAVCSANCRPHINDLIRALPNRGSLSHKNEGIIFRDVVNSILHQYCSICRTGCIL